MEMGPPTRPVKPRHASTELADKRLGVVEATRDHTCMQQRERPPISSVKYLAHAA